MKSMHEDALPAPPATPEDAVRAAIAALDAKRWRDVLHLIDPEDLAHFREAQVHSLRHALERRPRTADQIREAEPYLSLEAAAHQAIEETDIMERGRTWMLREWGVGGIEELDALSAEDLFLRWLAASGPDAKQRQAWAVSHTPVEDPAAIVAGHPPRITRDVLGAVPENDEAHVLYREVWGEANQFHRGTLKITTVRRTPAGWKLIIDHSLLGNGSHWIRVWRTDAPAPDAPLAEGSDRTL